MCHINPRYIFLNYSLTNCISKNWGIQKVLSQMQFMCLSSHWQFCVCTFRCLPLYQIVKQSDNWLWRYCISKIWGGGGTASVVTNAVALGPRRVAKFKYQRTNVPLGDINPTIKWYATLKSSRTDTHTHTDIQTETQTNSLNTIVSQPLCGSTNSSFL